MDRLRMAAALAALGHESRLGMFQLLVRAGHEGLSVGQIGQHTGLPASTLAHHLKALCDAGLVDQTRDGRSVINRANFDTMNAVVGYLTDRCCQGVGDNENHVDNAPSHSASARSERA